LCVFKLQHCCFMCTSFRINCAANDKETVFVPYIFFKVGSHFSCIITTLFCAVRPRFAPDHIKEVYIWAGKSRNITCHILAEPIPVIEWRHNGQSLVNNETYRIYVMSKDTNLQVASLSVVFWRFCCSAHLICCYIFTYDFWEMK